uniref:Uncharacterized protein n=1 Tax=Megaselia scalaris TaxID=36166 RepID=T1GNY7_MEGSC
MDNEENKQLSGTSSPPFLKFYYLRNKIKVNTNYLMKGISQKKNLEQRKDATLMELEHNLPGFQSSCHQPFCPYQYDVPYKQSPFFEEQLTAFQVWLNRASDKRTPPEQLPIVLQVLLSQVHRLRALELLGRFLDSGPWAVHLALGVGIFPYVLKLLQSAAKIIKTYFTI